jgi:hypothetical protein
MVSTAVVRNNRDFDCMVEAASAVVNHMIDGLNRPPGCFVRPG